MPYKELYAPSYYKKFKCIADKCRHSCCIDWEICIDDITLEKYKKIGRSITESIDFCEDDACFKLTDEGRCPHLNKNGLCDIIIAHGENFLSEICKNHPRFFNDVSCSVREAGLGIVCEEACRIILEDNSNFSLVKIGKALEDNEIPDDIDTSYFSAIQKRNIIIDIIENTDGNFLSKVDFIEKKFDISGLHTMDEWINRFLSLETLDEEWEKLLKENTMSLNRTNLQNEYNFDKYYERLLIYFVYRHVSTAKSPDNLRARLAFAILSVKMIKYLFEFENIKTLEKLTEIARLYSSEIEYSEDNTDELIFEFESKF